VERDRLTIGEFKVHLPHIRRSVIEVNVMAAMDGLAPGPQEEEQLNLSSGSPWSPLDDADIRWGLDHGRSVEDTADFLCRTPAEIRERVAEIAETDQIGDPSLLRDRRTARERIAIETYRDAYAALALIREAVEDCAPPDSVAREGYLNRDFTTQAEALVRGIYAIGAGRSRRRKSVGPLD
jgi:hypothetical protein